VLLIVDGVTVKETAAARPGHSSNTAHSAGGGRLVLRSEGREPNILVFIALS
jgi:hypothetical protein